MDPSKTNAHQAGKTYRIKLKILDDNGNTDELVISLKLQLDDQIPEEATQVEDVLSSEESKAEIVGQYYADLIAKKA